MARQIQAGDDCHPLRRSQGWTWNAEMLAPTSAIIGAGLGFCGTNYRWAFFWWYGMVVGHVAPEAAVGGAIALVQEGDTITIDADARLLHLHADAELERRRAAWQPRKPRYTTVCWQNTLVVSSSSVGAVTDLGCKSRLLI